MEVINVIKHQAAQQLNEAESKIIRLFLSCYNYKLEKVRFYVTDKNKVKHISQVEDKNT